jgi:predicted GNAT family acetyltransferase
MNSHSKSELRIEHQEHGSKGSYVARFADTEATGELTYSRMSDQLIIVDHTGVPDALRGKGVGAALAAHVVEQARSQGFRIIPLCPFFKAQAQRHPEWADVIK